MKNLVGTNHQGCSEAKLHDMNLDFSRDPCKRIIDRNGIYEFSERRERKRENNAMNLITIAASMQKKHRRPQ